MPSIFKKIGQFFKNLFNALHKAYNKLSPEQQEALQQGAGLVAIINSNLDAAPEKVKELIQAQYPELDVAKLEEALFNVAQSFGVTDLSDLDEAIMVIQNHLNSLEGKAWAIASHTAASVIAIAFGPKESKVATFLMLITWVYHTFIKKDTD